MLELATIVVLSAAASVLSPARAGMPRMVAAVPEGATSLPRPPLPKNAKVSWGVHKFGGASLATPELYKQCSDLLIDESRRNAEQIGSCVPTMAIVSARGGGASAGQSNLGSGSFLITHHPAMLLPLLSESKTIESQNLSISPSPSPHRSLRQ